MEEGAPGGAPLGKGKPPIVGVPPNTPPIEISIDQWIYFTPDALTWTSAGDLAVIDGATGMVKVTRGTADLGGVRDVIYDPWHARAVVFEGYLDDEGGEISTYDVGKTIGGHSLAPRIHESWVDGDVRLLPSPRGILVFEMGYGERWRVLFDDEETSASVIAPPPASAWITGSDKAFTIHALTYTDDGPFDRRAADVSWDVIGSPATSGMNASPGSYPQTARLLHAPARGDALLFDVAGSDVVVRPCNGATAGAPSLIPLGAPDQRIEDVVAFDGGEVALLLISGSSRVLAVETDAAGAVTHTDSFPLPGQVRMEDRFFSHDLAALGKHRALAATSAGVISIDIARDQAGVHLSVTPGFDGTSLRGPIAPIMPKPL